MTEMHIGDVGTVLTITVTDAVTGEALDISGATTKEILFRKPNGETEQEAADFATDGTDGKLSYTFIAGDLDCAGTWKTQAYVELPAGEWYSSAEAFQVDSNIAVRTT